MSVCSISESSHLPISPVPGIGITRTALFYFIGNYKNKFVYIEISFYICDMKNSAVYIIMKSVSEDYHGTYLDVVDVYEELAKAEAVCAQLNDDNTHYDTMYYVSNHLVK